MKVKCFLGYYLNPLYINIKPKHYFYGMVGLESKLSNSDNLSVDYYYNNRFEEGFIGRLKQSIKISYKIMTSNHDVLFAAFIEGIWFLIFLRALGIYRKPIVIWQHRPLRHSSNVLKNLFIKFFYRGCDRMFFFTQKHIDDAIKKNVINSHKLVLIDFGGDLTYFDKVKSTMFITKEINNHFISIGKENRDHKTIIEAFKKTAHNLDIYTTYKNGEVDYYNLLMELVNKYSNIKIVFTNELKTVFPTLFEISLNSFCVIISVFEYNYTVGLNQLVEAMAMGLPIITTDNPYYPFDVEKEGIGLKVNYGCINEWVDAINFLSSHPEAAKEMGRRGRHLAETKFNIENTIKQISGQLISVTKGK